MKISKKLIDEDKFLTALHTNAIEIPLVGNEKIETMANCHECILMMTSKSRMFKVFPIEDTWKVEQVIYNE